MNMLIQLKEVVDLKMGVDISQKSRKREYPSGRRIYCKLATRLFERNSLATIGSIVGIDHATVIHYSTGKGSYLTRTEEQVYSHILDSYENDPEIWTKVKEEQDLLAANEKIKELSSRLREEKRKQRWLQRDFEKTMAELKKNAISESEFKILSLYMDMNEKGKQDLIQKAVIIQKMNAA